MLRIIRGILVGVVALATSTTIFADPLVLPDLGLIADDVIQLGVTEGGTVIGIGLAFAVGILIVFFGYRLLKRILFYYAIEI